MNTAVKLTEHREYGCIDPGQTEELLSMQLSILEMIANDMKTDRVLEELCYLSEAMLPNSVASIMLFDETRHHLNVRTAPSIPAEGIAYLDGLKPGPKSGSCGTAVFTGEPVFVENTLTDYRWHQFRDFSKLFNINACWSMPIRSSNETTIGSFALTSFENRKPDYFHRCLLDTSAHLVAIILEREDHQQRLQLASIAFENINEGIIVTDADRRIIEVNQAFTDITGYQLEDVIFRNPRVLSSGLESPEFYHKFWHDLETYGHWSGEIRNRRKNGEVFTEWLSVKCVYDDNGEVANYVSILTDISQLKEAEEKLRHLAHHDTLTNLPNRLYFQDRLDQALSHASRMEKRLGLLFLDLDNFKNVNDSLGHQVGDELLQRVSEQLYKSLRKHDVIARHGGDEFLVLIEDIEDPLELRHIADHIQENLRHPVHVNNIEFNISASIGISIYPDNGTTRDSLLRNADAAMYEAKKNGRNRVAFYTPELTDTVQARVSLEGDFRRALNTKQFTLNYQPQFNASNGELIGAEVLVRWHHPQRGLIPPSEFIPIAEETGLINELGCWITTTACHQAQAWREKGLKEFQLAINLSPHQLSDSCAFKLARILDTTGFPAHLLEFEITESLLMESGCKAIQQLFSIKELGIGLSMDDFGTGHSSMSQLKHLPIQKLKIDRSFIRDIPGDPNDVAITRSIIALGHALELKVLAEGVETEEQMEFLKREKCDALQGYYLGRPITAEGFEAILNNQ
ncbi:MAG: EAL domain-containing protein [Candidatus Thiodiazotropha sp. (ex Monitilora ramsayi)]|nr:EAL domain-containing protein [Candidatus Thiodiazotropha sp. (ex Monitilora ramsayi)]